MFDRLADIERTYEDLNAKLADPTILGDHKAYADTNRHIVEIRPLVDLYRQHASIARQIREVKEMLATVSKDDEMYTFAEEELATLEPRLLAAEEALRVELTPKDPNDARNVVLEIRADTGGDEASLFAAELFRMY